MPDEIDRDQAFNERCLEALIEQSRLRPTPTPSCSTVDFAARLFRKNAVRRCRV